MTDMVRKQIYISRRQQAFLKRISLLRGLSEAEIIRQAIDREAGKILPQPAQASEQAWQDELNFMHALRERSERYPEPVHWDREALYEERMNRLLEDRPPYNAKDEGQSE
jgi:hypothetical protein